MAYTPITVKHVEQVLITQLYYSYADIILGPIVRGNILQFPCNETDPSVWSTSPIAVIINTRFKICPLAMPPISTSYCKHITWPESLFTRIIYNVALIV